MRFIPRQIYRQSHLARIIPTWEADEFIDYWNERIWLPKIRGTDRQKKLVTLALTRPFFRENWKEGILMVGKSKWLRDKMRPAFSLEFFLDPDSFDKIVEGKYVDRNENKVKKTLEIKTKLVDKWDEEIL